MLDTFTLEIQNYKCFGSEFSGFQKISPINLIVGKNNTGKSSLLDLLEYVTAPHRIDAFRHNGHMPKVRISTLLQDEKILKNVFPENTHGGELTSYSYHWDYGRFWIGKKLYWELKENGKGESPEPDSFEPIRGIRPEESQNTILKKCNELLRWLEHPLKEYRFCRLSPDRDIIPEPDDGAHPLKTSHPNTLKRQHSSLAAMNGNGDGATTIIRNFLTQSYLPKELVEETLLKELNFICNPDCNFKRIETPQHQNKTWEVYLTEDNKGRIAISATGSGIKTILLILIYLHLFPAIENIPIEKYVFGFEELENNLHPALQRRLLKYLCETASEKKCHFFLTTHSNVFIDVLSKDENAQIIHVTHDGEKAQTSIVSGYQKSQEILDDLGVRASDLLQANAIVWVEGPSDRLYFNHWIKLWTDNQICEGLHYQCVFYGGRLLSRFTAQAPDSSDDFVNLLRVNRNAIILMDSDKKNRDDTLNSTKRRIIEEASQIEAISWVTAGKEIEHYISKAVLARFYEKSEIPSFNRYTDFASYLNRIKQDEGKAYLRDKVGFAEAIIHHITKEDLESTFDMKEQLDNVRDKITSWNS